MRKYWLITDREIHPPASISRVFKGTSFSVFASQGDSRFFSLEGHNTMILVDGYVMPVMSVLHEFHNLFQEELIFATYKKYGTDFINYIKGNFSIVIAEENCFYVYNDHLGIRKIFYSANNDLILITNKFNFAASLVKLNPSPENIAIHSLLHHFVAGITFSKEIFYSEQATVFEFNPSTGFKKRTYWDISSLVHSLTTCSREEDLIEYFNEVILSYLRFFKPSNICMTLTGGMDSRLILAILLKNNIKPGTYAYGNPRSGDVIIAGKISEIFGLDFKNHYREHPDSLWFNELCDEILESGDSVTHFHRAFRLAGIKAERSERQGTDMVFGGFMGGEGIKGVHYDDLIITKFTRIYRPESVNKEELMSGFLDNCFIDQTDLSYEYLIDFIDHLPWYGKDKKENEFLLNFILNASNHLAQDINFYHLYFPLFVNPYMDIDYLRFLFGSTFSMLHKDNTSSNQLRRLEIPRFHCNAIRSSSRELAEIQFSSGFSPNDYLFSRYYYALKRALHKKLNKKYQPHFTYGNWYLQFIMDDFGKIGPLTGKLFNLQQAGRELSSSSPKAEERFWHRFTNVVMINKMINFYNKQESF